MSAAVLGTLYLPIEKAHTYSDKAAMRAVDYFRADTLTNAPSTFSLIQNKHLLLPSLALGVAGRLLEKEEGERGEEEESAFERRRGRCRPWEGGGRGKER